MYVLLYCIEMLKDSKFGNVFFLTFSACFSIPKFFSNLNLNCSNLSSLRNFQEQVKKAFCYQKLFWPFTVWINCSSHLKNFENSWLSASNFKSFSRSLEQFFLTVGQNNFGNKIPFFDVPDPSERISLYCDSELYAAKIDMELYFLASLNLQDI